MKRLYQTMLGLLLTACLLVTFWAETPVMAADGEEPEDISAVMLDPVNPRASREAKNLLAYLQTLNDSDCFVTGTFDMATNSQVYDAIREQFGVEPGLYSARYTVNTGEKLLTAHANAVSAEELDEDVLAFTNVEQANEQLKLHYERGNILLVHSDSIIRNICSRILMQNRPEEYFDGTDGVQELDSTNPERDLLAYAAWVRYQDNLIAALRQLEDAGVKAYLWRPWVEFNYHAFFGTTEESNEAFVRVFRQTVDRMKEAGLTGFLVTYSPGAASATLDRYPGNAYADVLSVTLYSENPSKVPGEGGAYVPTQFEDYSWYVKTGKPIGLSETSCRSGMWQTIASAGRQSWYQALLSMQTNWPRVSWVNCWADGAYSLVNESNGNPENGNDDGYWYLTSPFSLNLEDLPDYRRQTLDKPGVVQLYTQRDFGGNSGNTLHNNWYGLEQKAYSYRELKAMGLDPADIASFHINAGYALRCYTGDNLDGTSWSYLTGTGDAQALASGGKIRSLEVVTPRVVSLEADIYASDQEDTAWKANDGEYTRWEGLADENGQGWLMLDLGEPCIVSRWLVRHAGSVGVVSLYNTADYGLQYSLDGQNWITADRVENNELSMTDRTLSLPVTARYFRLLITRPNQVAQGADVRQMTIVEWELYGLPTALAEGELPGADGEESAEATEVIESLDEPDETDDSGDIPEEESGEGLRENTKQKVKRVIRTVVFPWWGYGLMAAGVLLIAGMIWLLLWRHRRKQTAVAAGDADRPVH